MYTLIEAHPLCLTSSKHGYSQKASQAVTLYHTIPLVIVKWKDTIGILWKSVLLALKSSNIPTTEWEMVLPDPLQSLTLLL